MRAGSGELSRKLSGLDDALQRRSAPGVWIRQGRNIAWLLGGRPHVGLFGSEGVASLVYKDGELHLIADNVELKRLLTEEFSGVELDIVESMWYEKPSERQRIEARFGAGLVSDDALEDEIRPLRMCLGPEERSTLRWLGGKVAEAVQHACLECSPGMSEHEMAGLMAGSAASSGVEANVLIAAADDRISGYRHPLPTDKRLKKIAMLTLVGRKDGLYAGLTRFVCFGVPEEGLLKKQLCLGRIYARMAARTRPGADLKDIFAGLVDDYGKEGYPGEWRNHHQGGPTGYAARELKAAPDLSFKVAEGQAYTWNPTVQGFKVEDTFIVGPDTNERITRTPRIPEMEVVELGTRTAVSDVLYR